MIVKFLGIFDLACMLCILLFAWIPNSIIMKLGMLLMLKGILFATFKDIPSIIDALAGLYIGLMVYGLNAPLISGFFVIFLAQKGLLSLLAR
ncbi:MAG: hypothetical protein ACMXYG_03715 [Candidatus Woesearchaeota archaeon]